MRRGSHRVATARARWPIVLGIAVAVVVGAAAVWYVLLQADGPVGEDRGVVEFSFQLGRIGGTAVAERAPEEVLLQAARGVRRTLNEMYVAGFVDPAKWQNGRHPEVLRAFAEETRRRARRDIELLALASDAPHIQRMVPVNRRLNVRFLVDEEQQPTAAVATTNFTAEGTLRAGGPAFAGHFGTYHLRPEGRRWLIVGYDVRIQVGAGQLPEPQRSPQPGPTTQETG